MGKISEKTVVSSSESGCLKFAVVYYGSVLVVWLRFTSSHRYKCFVLIHDPDVTCVVRNCINNTIKIVLRELILLLQHKEHNILDQV